MSAPNIPTEPKPVFNESAIILIAGLIQFINVTDFMMVMPLGPDFAKALGIASSSIGLIGASYTFAAACAGIIAAFFLDNFHRKRALLFVLMGLIIATAGGAFVWNEASMVAVRLLAGAFGGPLTALGMALIADTIPVERRGQAMGKMMGGFAAASVLGVPFGLELARIFSWHAPFISTAALGLGVWFYAYRRLVSYPPVNKPRGMSVMLTSIIDIVMTPKALLSFALMTLTMGAGFIIIPNISAHLQMNLGYPREHLGILYMCGGSISFFSMRLVGILVDKWSGTAVVSFLTTLLIIVMYAGFVMAEPPMPIIVIFILFMVCMTGRGVCSQTLSSEVPAPSQRGTYMALQSSITHISSSVGAYYSSTVLHEEGGRLLHVQTIAWTAIIISLAIPLLFWVLERMVKRSIRRA